MSDIQAFIENRRKLGYSDRKIKDELLRNGWREEDINKYLNVTSAKITGKEILYSNPKYIKNQKIIIGWLVGYLILRVLLAFLLIMQGLKVGADVSIFVAFVNLFYILPGIIVLIGLLKVKAWAYWFYILGLFFSLDTFFHANNKTELVVSLVLTAGSFIVFILTVTLYRNIFPSKKSQAAQRINQ